MDSKGEEVRREREREEGPQKREKKRRRRKNLNSNKGEKERVFVGNYLEEEEEINRKWRPTGPTRRAKAGNGGRGKATRTFLSGKS